jgi:hypothetical protein
MSSAITPQEAVRLRTWAIDIATTLLPEAPQRDEGHDRRFGDAGGLAIDTRRGCWYSYAAGRGGWSTLDLIRILNPNYSCTDVEQWALSWLENHSGIGSCDGTYSDDDELGDDAASRANAFVAREILNAAISAKGTPAEIYLSSRGSPGAYPDCVQWLADARTGEGPLVGILRSHDRTVGVQLTYLDPDGR